MRNSRIARIVIPISLLLLLSGCFVPKPVQEKEQACLLETKKLTLEYPKDGIGKTLQAMGAVASACGAPECLVVSLGVLVVPAGSYIVSGSIVVVGNTIHWIEKQGRCEDSTVRSALNDLVKYLKSFGGKTIQTEQELIDWLRRQPEID